MAKQQFTELANPGMVRLWHKKTGKPHDVFPVDAREILDQENSEYAADEGAIELATETAKGHLNVDEMDELLEEDGILIGDEAKEKPKAKTATKTKPQARKK